jgi:hypothetical protein
MAGLPSRFPGFNAARRGGDLLGEFGASISDATDADGTFTVMRYLKLKDHASPARFGAAGWRYAVRKGLSAEFTCVACETLNWPGFSGDPVI